MKTTRCDVCYKVPALSHFTSALLTPVRHVSELDDESYDAIERPRREYDLCDECAEILAKIVIERHIKLNPKGVRIYEGGEVDAIDRKGWPLD